MFKITIEKDGEKLKEIERKEVYKYPIGSLVPNEMEKKLYELVS